MDTSLLCYLVGLRDVEHAFAGPMGGAIFENLVIADLYKTYLHRGEEPPLYYWRTAAGSEVDWSSKPNPVWSRLKSNSLKPRVWRWQKKSRHFGETSRRKR